MALAVYVHVGTLSVMIWDIVNHSKKDYHLLFSYEFCMQVNLYITARYMTFIYALVKTAYLTIRMPNCHSFDSAISTLYIVAICATLLQSSIRLWKLLGRKGNVFAFLGGLWILATGGSVALAVGVVGREPVVPLPLDSASATSVCINHIKGDYVSLAFIVLVVYHACLLAMVVLAMRQNVFVDKERLSIPERYERMVRGASSLFLAKPLTADDRIFHVSATVLSLASMVWFFASSVGHNNDSDVPLRLMLAIVYIVPTNILMGRIFRHSTLRDRETTQRVDAPPAPPPGLRLDLNTGRHIELQDTNGSRKKTLCGDQGPVINRVIKLGDRPETYDDSPSHGDMPVEVGVQQVTEYKSDFAVQSECHSEGPIQLGGHSMFGIKIC